MQKSFTKQPILFVSATELNHPIIHGINDTEALLDWSDIETLLSSIYASFRKFCHFELDEDVPEASTLGRFRIRLVEHHLWDKLLAEINRQIEHS
ncbi:MAG: transposase [Endozoicomonadaceae bacterium]|nr:transposase [Endozoicomonadaceae bacterium]